MRKVSWKDFNPRRRINEFEEYEDDDENEIFMLEEKPKKKSTELELETIEITEADYEYKIKKIQKEVKQISSKEKGKNYEDEVITKMRKLGIDVVKTSETTNSGQIIGDGGIDAIIQDENGLIFVQIKDWKGNVGTDIINNMTSLLSLSSSM